MDPGTAALLSAGISSATDLIGGIFGRSGQRDTNRRNLQIAREQMAFQERMSNTAYQRAAKDLQAAGLNRILALGKPATTPAGALATMQNPEGPLQQGISNAAMKMHSALELKRKAKEIEQIGARTRLTDAQADVIQPGAEAGEQIGNWIGNIREAPYGAMWDRMKQHAGQFLRSSPATSAAGIKMEDTALAAARNVLRQSLKGMDVRPEVAERELIKTVSQMDIPPGLTEEQMLVWGIQNLDKVRRFVRRQNQ